MRAKEIDGMKGALIFLVVLGHFLLPLLGFGARSINLPFDLIYSFHMPAFVFLSGLFAGHALRSPRHWCKRCLTLLWLYLCFKWLVFYPERAAYQTGGTWPDFGMRAAPLGLCSRSFSGRSPCRSLLCYGASFLQRRCCF